MNGSHQVAGSAVMRSPRVNLCRVRMAWIAEARGRSLSARKDFLKDIHQEGFPMRQLRLRDADGRTLGDLKQDGRERLMTACDICGNTNNFWLDQLIAQYPAETPVLRFLAILHARCGGVGGNCAMKTLD